MRPDLPAVRIPVVVYHALGDGPAPIWTPLDRFDAELEAFAHAGYRAIRLGDLVDGLRQGRALPPRAFAITFDDGYRSVHQEALPRLARRGWAATAFLVTSRCGGTNRWPGQAASVPEAPLFDWDAAGELLEAGWELGAHGATHAPLTTLPLDRAEEEIAGSLEAIERRVGPDARLFAYPYGASDREVRAIARRFARGAAGTGLGLVGARSDPFDLERIDACYLSPRLVERLERPSARARLHVRRWLRRARRVLVQDWDGGFRPST
ncbi:MAG: polysaccharide deacetylase family protein [Gemmatimonadota bacterium]